jgi:hypothetical protein
MKGKYSGQDVIEVADAPYAPDHCKEQGFIDYSKQVITSNQEQEQESGRKQAGSSRKR